MEKKAQKTNVENDLQKILYEYSIENVVENIEKEDDIRKLHLPKNKMSQFVKQHRDNQIALMYQECYTMLENSINICFYGIGSQFETIQNFVDQFYKNKIVVTIKGFNTAIFMHNILVKILQALEKFGDIDLMQDTEKVLNKRKPNNETTKQEIIKLLNILPDFGTRLVLVFHNLDGKNFREIEHQVTLSELAKHEQVRFIASFSHCYYPNFLTKKVLLDYNFCFVPNSFADPLKRELIFDEISWLNKQEKKGKDSLEMVSQSLTEGQREVLVLLANALLDSPTGNIEYFKFFDLCVEEMLLNEQKQLTDNLAEAVDHKIVLIKTNENGKRFLSMPFANDVIRAYAEAAEED